MPKKFFVGIDVAKLKHTASAIDSDGEVVIPPFDLGNDSGGIDSLVGRIKGLGGEVSVGLEATGHYHACLVERLEAAGIEPSVINPSLIHGFKKSVSATRAKTDRNDSLLIAEYGLRIGFPKPHGKSYYAERLKSLARSMSRLIRDRSRAYNLIVKSLDATFPELLGALSRRPDGTPRSTRGRNLLSGDGVRELIARFPSAEAMAGAKGKDAEAVRKASRGSISAMSFGGLVSLAKRSIGRPDAGAEVSIRELVQRCRLIDSAIAEIEAREAAALRDRPFEFTKIKGVGVRLGAAIAGEVGDFSLFPTAESLVKYSGLVPTQYQSGKVDRKGRMEKKGPALLRHSLIEASLKVVLHNPAWAAYYRRKCEGKFYRVALTHVAVKLLRSIWTIEHGGLKFDPHRFNPEASIDE